MVDTYIVKATSTAGAGTITFPVGTVFPGQADPSYNSDTGKLEEAREVYALEGIFQEGTRAQNFAKFFDLFDFTNEAGIVKIEFLFGSSSIRTLNPGARGPVLRNCRLVQRAGALATHAHFSIEIDDTRDHTTFEKEAKQLERSKRQEFFEGLLQRTTYSVRARGKDAKKLVDKFKIQKDQGVVTQDRIHQVDARTFEKSWTLEVPHKGGHYLSWERTVEIAPGGNPLEQIQVLADPAGIDSGPVIRKGLAVAFTVTDSSTFETLGDWLDSLPNVELILPASMRDPTRSDRFTRDKLIDANRDKWRRTLKDVFLVRTESDLASIKAITLPVAAVPKEPTDPTDWEKFPKK